MEECIISKDIMYIILDYCFYDYNSWIVIRKVCNSIYKLSNNITKLNNKDFRFFEYAIYNNISFYKDWLKQEYNAGPNIKQFLLYSCKTNKVDLFKRLNESFNLKYHTKIIHKCFYYCHYFKDGLLCKEMIQNKIIPNISFCDIYIELINNCMENDNNVVLYEIITFLSIKRQYVSYYVEKLIKMTTIYKKHFSFITDYFNLQNKYTKSDIFYYYINNKYYILGIQYLKYILDVYKISDFEFDIIFNIILKLENPNEALIILKNANFKPTSSQLLKLIYNNKLKEFKFFLTLDTWIPFSIRQLIKESYKNFYIELYNNDKLIIEKCIINITDHNKTILFENISNNKLPNLNITISQIDSKLNISSYHWLKSVVKGNQLKDYITFLIKNAYKLCILD